MKSDGEDEGGVKRTKRLITKAYQVSGGRDVMGIERLVSEGEESRKLSDFTKAYQIR